MKIELRGKKWKQISRNEWRKLLVRDYPTAHFIENGNDETTYFKLIIINDTDSTKGETQGGKE